MKKIYCNNCGKEITFDEAAVTEKVFCNYCGTANFPAEINSDIKPLIEPNQTVTPVIASGPMTNNNVVQNTNVPKKKEFSFCKQFFSILGIVAISIVVVVSIIVNVSDFINKPHKLSRSEKNELREECDIVNYSRVAHNPDRYEGDYIQVTGTVIQVSDGGRNKVIIRVMDDDLNVWYIVYYYYDGETRIVEDDEVTVYGRCTGTTTYKSTRGDSVTIPSIRALLIE